MSLFVTEKTVKVYFNKDGEISKKETPDWIEVLEVLPFELGEKIKKRISPTEMKYLSDGSYSVNIENTVTIPSDILVQIIKGWSESVPVTPENIAKLDNKIVEKLWSHLQRMYGLTGATK